ncbi:hypothetical protein GCM10009838_11130 [Catenulispora subtropica]|uniref:Uncharacterized protein n=1 Tax=Catenulispora subtropica TaxID=450798 RepID=A0ABN2QR81_9ACTN
MPGRDLGGHDQRERDDQAQREQSCTHASQVVEYRIAVWSFGSAVKMIESSSRIMK